MLKSEKEELIRELEGKFAQVKSAVLAEFRGLNVETVTRLRAKFREEGIEYRVLKNTLAKRAAKGTVIETISADFVGPVAIAMSTTDPIAPAKVLHDFVKDLQALQVKCGVVDGKRIDAAGVKALAKMPSLNELRATLAGMINQPASTLARLIGTPGNQLARVVKAREESLGKQS